MRRSVAVLALFLAACRPAPEEQHPQAILGAVLIDGLGGPPLSNSVVLIAGGEIRQVGAASTVPIPAGADRIDGAGRFLIPAPVDLAPDAAPVASVRAASPDEARTATSALVRSRAPVIYLETASPPAVRAVFEVAREAGTPVFARASTQDEVRLLVDQGAAAIVGIIGDTTAIDPALLARCRDLRVVFAPSLAVMAPGPALETARRNTRALFAAGVPLAIASRGGDPLREAEALADAGIPPLDVIVAATRHGALAFRQSERRGVIRPGCAAELLLLSANPGEDIRNLRRVSARFRSGQWTRQ